MNVIDDTPIYHVSALRARVNGLEVELAEERRRRCAAENSLYRLRALALEAAAEIDRRRHVGDCDELVARLREVGR